MSDFLEDLLNSSTEEVGNFEAEDAKLAPLLPEISLISDPAIKLFVRSILYQTHNFWSIPASFSGQYHPPDERGLAGNLLHTKRVVRIVEMLCRSQERMQLEVDILLAAALLHDITKGVEHADGSLHYDPMHPYTVDHFVALVLQRDEANADSANRSSGLYITEDVLAKILRIIHCHMGPYSPIPETFPITSSDWILHFADIIATNLHHIIDGDEVKDWRWNEPAPRKRRTKAPEENLADK